MPALPEQNSMPMHSQSPNVQPNLGDMSGMPQHRAGFFVQSPDFKFSPEGPPGIQPQPQEAAFLDPWQRFYNTPEPGAPRMQ